jgi:hypothetical protein
VLQERLEPLELKAFEAFKVFKARPVSRVFKVREVGLVQLDLLAQQVQLALRVSRELPDLQAQLDQLELKVHMQFLTRHQVVL